MTEKNEPILSIETLHVDDEHSHVIIALRGLNARTINHRSTTLYHVIAGEGVMYLDDDGYDLKPGAVIEVPPNTPYHDEGNVDMEAVSIPPFNIADVEVIEE